ncbi:hypothetical protein BN77_2918 [Rhizobium mesoamericanum STM3625]|uniref:Uncharacterized protein n=1 Tax=Rhizobium mesoamericanum STM3625 TaxID=1211777 RepID=K0Q075_9HYPH|nr:hypothetical protein BN77_2918 [Rhizobium mesoamericanum STM3625]
MISQRERLLRPRLSLDVAKAELRDWYAAILQRVGSLRTSAARESIRLTPPQIIAPVANGVWMVHRSAR